ncbi:MAG: hypothetical protein WB930_09265 [Syntrophobacteraceae bacterium]
MTIYDELLGLCITSQDRLIKYKTESIGLIQQFARRMSEYIGAPNTYVDYDKLEKPYVKALNATRNDDGSITFGEPKSILTSVTEDEDGYWISGIKIVIGRANILPKPYFIFPVRFILRERQCELEIGNRSGENFIFDLDEFNSSSGVIPTGVQAAYDYMIEHLRKVLALSPWSVIREKAPIGFVAKQVPTES